MKTYISNKNKDKFKNACKEGDIEYVKKMIEHDNYFEVLLFGWK